MAPVVEAHKILSRTRQSGFGFNPIQLSEMESFCRIYKVNNPIRMIEMLLLIDEVYLEKASKKEKQSDG